MSNSKTSKKRRPWPPQRRAAQAARIRVNRPWDHTTGPRTDAGKAAVAGNAFRHGLRAAETIELHRTLRRVLTHQKAFVKAALARQGEQNMVI